MEKKIDFKSYDGTNLVGIIMQPSKVESAVIMMHGLPSNKDEWGFYKDMATFFYEHNVASFRFDFRYNGESQKGDFSDLTISEMVNDIDSAYWTFLEELKNPNVIMSIVGTSCGGGLSVKWANVYKRNVSKVFLNAPVLDYEYEVTGEKKKGITTFSSLSPSNLETLSEKKTLNPDIGYGFQMINEAHLFDIEEEFKNCKLPITIFHGNEDTIVPLSLTNESIEGFENIELIIIDKANHGFAVEGDDDLTAEGTKTNHFLVYNEILKRLQ